MENYFNNKSLLYVVPENIEFSSVFEFSELKENELILKTSNENFRANILEEIEVFSSISNGILYFKSKVKSYADGVLVTDKPAETELLQRRENERVLINEDIELTDSENKIFSAKILDLSVGGIKVLTNTQVSIKHKYKSVFNFDNLNLKFTFVPIRITYNEDEDNENYITSGQIFLDSPKDKIELVQYCYKKLFEQNNRG